MLALILAGGASRADEFQQTLVRLAAVVVIAASLWPLEFGRLRQHRGWLAGVAAAYALVLVQIIPLPHAVWAQLPGHSIYARIAEQTGSVGWRPLSLTPDLTLNALFALMPATAAGLAALYLDSYGRRQLARGIMAAACLSGVLGLIQLGTGGNALHFFRQSSADSAVGIFANRNHQAALLACALPLAGALAGSRLRDGVNLRTLALFGMLVALLLFALVATGSRMGLALGLIGLVGAAWCFIVGGGTIKDIPRRGMAGAAAVILALLVAIAIAARRTSLIDRLMATDTLSDTRVTMLQPLFETARAFMPWGSGFGSFDSVYRRFEPDALLSTIYMNQAHNEPMQLAIEGGVPALALLALFLVWWIVTVIKVLRARIPSGRRAMAIAAGLVTLILMLSSLIDYPLRTPLLGALFAIACVELMRTAAASASTGREPEAAG